MKIPILASQVYGSATDEIRDALTFVSSISWFRTPKLVSQQELDNLVQKHLTSVEAFAKVDLSQVNRVGKLVGGLELLHENRWAVDPYLPWGNRWSTSWATLNNKVVGPIKEAITESSKLRDRYGPPLWPFRGNLSIGGTVIIPHEKILLDLSLKKGTRDWTAAWGLLCRAENLLWAWFAWLISADELKGICPFSPLFELYKIGYFPMGWEGNFYSLFGFINKSPNGIK